jgi:hypothetical protein
VKATSVLVDQDLAARNVNSVVPAAIRSISAGANSEQRRLARNAWILILAASARRWCGETEAHYDDVAHRRDGRG